MDATTVNPFWALGDPISRRIVDVLASGEHTAGQIADVVNAEFRVSRTSASKHLRILRDAGLVDVRAEEQWRWYRLRADGVDTLEHEIADLRAKMGFALGWDADASEHHDPLRGWARPPRKGPGRDPRPGTRGTQRTRVFEHGPDERVPPPPFVDHSGYAHPVPEDDAETDEWDVYDGDGDDAHGAGPATGS